jgi:uncharacterized protein YecT (DUF1311 family)
MLLSSLAGVLTLFAVPQASGPSFNCARASTLSEHAICADPALGRLDRRMADRYVAVRRALPSAAREALTRDQRWFIGSREEWQENSGRGGFRDFPDLADRMSGRIDFLDSLQTRRATGLNGVWRNAAGMIEIRPDAKGQVAIDINAAHPVNARWLCNVSGTTQVNGGVATIAAGDGWRIRLSLEGGYLKVEELPPPGGQGVAPYCGANGHLGTAYFLTR